MNELEESSRELRVRQGAVRSKRIGCPHKRQLPIEDACTARGQDLPQLGLRPDPPKNPVLAPTTATGLSRRTFVA